MNTPGRSGTAREAPSDDQGVQPAARFTNRDKMRCAQREVNQREWVYAKKVNAGTMTQAKATEEIALMKEIALDYGAAAEQEEKAGRLL